MPASPGGAYPYPSQRVVVLRHGERRDSHPDAPAESNPPLTPEGVAAIEITAARLKHYLGEAAARSAILVVSPFLRTVQTAESLQHHGVGTDHAMVVDNTLCEVFGPSRIKTSRAPQLPAHPTSRAVGGLPVWGESLETATERYVANFLRNGDVYGGPLARGASDSSFGGRQESQTSSSLLCPAAVTKRVNGANNNNNNNSNYGGSSGAGSGATPGSPDSAMVSNLRGDKPRDVILVTHGDAISAVLSYFYPARVVYEAEFLSFIIMRRYGPNNHVYHLDESAGVNWFVEGIDREPVDPVLNALEVEREAAAALARRSQTNRVATVLNMQPNGKVIGSGDGVVDSDEDLDDGDPDDEGDSLDDDGEGPAHQPSFVGSRMKSRTSRLPARRVPPPSQQQAQAQQAAPRAAAMTATTATTTAAGAAPAPAQRATAARTSDEANSAMVSMAPALPATQVHPPLLHNVHPAAAHHRRGTTASSGSTASSNNNNNDLGGGSGGTGQARTPHAVGSSSSNGGSGGTHGHARHHPKAGEDCERIRLPGGTPAQSSSSPVNRTTDDSSEHRRGHSRSSSRSSSSNNNSESGNSSLPSDNVTASAAGPAGEVEEEGRATAEEGQLKDSPGQPLSLSYRSEMSKSSAANWKDGTRMDSLLRDMSSYGGLTADTSANSWVKAKVDSVNYFSAYAVREQSPSTVLVPPTPPQSVQQPVESPPLLPQQALPESPVIAATPKALAGVALPPITIANTNTNSSTNTAGTSAPSPLPSSQPDSTINSSPTLTARTLSRNGSAVVSPAVRSARRGVAYAGAGTNSAYTTTPVLHQGTASFEDSTTSAQPWTATAAPSAPFESGGGADGDDGADRGGAGYPPPTTMNLARRIDRQKAVSKATRVSCVLRLVCFVPLLITSGVLGKHEEVVWYCVLGCAWELVAAAMLMFSCQAKYPRLLVVREGVEQLRFTACRALWRARPLDRQIPYDHAPPATADAQEDEGHDAPFYHFNEATANSTNYESSMTWQAGQHAIGDDDASHSGSLQNAKSRLGVALLCARHVAATALKLFALYLLGFVFSLTTEAHPARAFNGVSRVYTQPAGLVLTLVYGCVNVVRGVWDETRIDSILDAR